MIQLTLVTTLFGAASAAAAIDAGLLGEADSRVLVVANNAPVPEAVPLFIETPGATAVTARFDRVVDLGALLSPQRPAHWTVEEIDTPAQERLLRTYMGLGDAPVSLVLESVHVAPAATMAAIFAASRITILSEGLMSYGPTRNAQSHAFGQRLDGMVYLDLVEGLDPLLLSEHGIAYRPLAPAAFRRVIEDVCEAQSMPHVTHDEPTVLVLGQYLAALRLVTPAEEAAMQVRMFDAARELGATRILFKPHPSSPATPSAELASAAHERGLSLELVSPALSAEAVMATHALAGVVAGFSTALTTASRVFGLPTRSTDTAHMLARLKPHPNSNRIPLVIIDHLGRQGDGPESIAELRSLTVAVAFTMQPKTLAHRRDDAVAFLEHADAETRLRYFPRERLTALQLPGGEPRGRASTLARDALEHIPPGLAVRARAFLLRAKVVRDKAE